MAGGLALLSTLLPPPAVAASAEGLFFRPAGSNEFTFDTGMLRGRLRPDGRALGLASVTHLPTGAALDRGTNGYGLFSHYRVFSHGRRYGTAAWDWPGGARLLHDGGVAAHWPAAPDRPFEMQVIYRWAGPDRLDCETQVRPQRDLPGFEVFLASYFQEGFTNALVLVAEPPGRAPEPGLLAAEKARGDWQMFPRDVEATLVIGDGRWQLPPHPVQWTLGPRLHRPVAVRRAASSGLAVLLLGHPEDCFAVAMPFQTEGHYSVYLSLFGRDLKAGETARARTRLVVTAASSDKRLLEECLKQARAFAKTR
jgi:hypothetical protein